MLDLLLVFSSAPWSIKCSRIDSVDSAVDSEIYESTQILILWKRWLLRSPSPLPWGVDGKPPTSFGGFGRALSGGWISWAVSHSWSSKEQTTCHRWSIDAIACPGVWGFSKRNSQEEIQAWDVISTTLSWHLVRGDYEGGSLPSKCSQHMCLRQRKTGGKGLSDLSLSRFFFLYQYPSIFFPPLYIGKVELPLVWSHHLGWSFKILGVQEKPISILSCIRVIILVVSELWD